MIQNLPIYITLTFLLATVATLLLFVLVIKNANPSGSHLTVSKIITGLLIWLFIQGILAWSGFYHSSTDSLLPNIAMAGVFPPILIITFLFATNSGRRFIDSLPLKHLTYLNIVRIPVEIVLYWLFLYKAVPQLMTFEGRNFDIIAGVTAPLIAYFAFTKSKLSRRIILAWNIVCLGLLINIIVNAFLSAPSPLQKFAFEQPNIAILYFPFCYLPSYIVPIVLFGHLVSIRQLIQKKDN